MTIIGPVPFVCLFLATVWGAVLMIGQSWLTATATTLFACSCCMIASTAWWMVGEYYIDRRIWVEHEFAPEDPPTSVRVVPAEQGDHNIVLGIRAGSYSPEVVIGRACVDPLRAAGVA